MTDYDKASRMASQEDPVALTEIISRLAQQKFEFDQWRDTRTTPMLEERDQTADRVAVVFDVEHPQQPWLVPMEFQYAPNFEKLISLIAESGGFLRDVRHGENRDKLFKVLPVMVNLTGTLAEEEIDHRVKSGKGLHQAPLCWNLCEEDANEALDRLESAQTTWGILFWIPLMKNADKPELLARWQQLLLLAPEPKRLTVISIAFTFAGLAKRGQLWNRVLQEDRVMGESEFLSGWTAKAREQSALSTAKNMLKTLLRDRFANQEMQDILQCIDQQPSVELLTAWLLQAARVGSIAEFRTFLRQRPK
jgi:hypothetical protein